MSSAGLSTESQPADLLKAWNLSKPVACSAAKELSDTRRKKASARIREHAKDDGGALAWWGRVLAKVNASPLLRGDKGGWCADFDWLLEPGNLLKVEEGKYEDRQGGARKPSNAISDEAKKFHAERIGVIHDF